MLARVWIFGFLVVGALAAFTIYRLVRSWSVARDRLNPRPPTAP